jgi:hypothetical protein
MVREQCESGEKKEVDLLLDLRGYYYHFGPRCRYLLWCCQAAATKGMMRPSLITITVSTHR